MFIPPFAWKNKYVLTHGHMTLVSCGSKSNLAVAKNELPPIPRIFSLKLGIRVSPFWDRLNSTGAIPLVIPPLLFSVPIFPSSHLPIYLPIDRSIHPSKNRFKIGVPKTWMENNKQTPAPVLFLNFWPMAMPIWSSIFWTNESRWGLVTLG